VDQNTLYYAFWIAGFFLWLMSKIIEIWQRAIIASHLKRGPIEYLNVTTVAGNPERPHAHQIPTRPREHGKAGDHTKGDR